MMMRAKSIGYAEYEILRWMMSQTDMSVLRQRMVDDVKDADMRENAGERFDKAAKNVKEMLQSKADVRRKYCPKEHPDAVSE